MSATRYPHDQHAFGVDRSDSSRGVRRIPGGHDILASIRIDGTGALRDLRSAVLETAGAAGLAEQRVADVALAANEIATNAIVHGGGSASVQIWLDQTAWRCDVIDDGPGLRNPAAGTEPPGVREGGFGMWIAASWPMSSRSFRAIEGCT